MGQDIDQIKAQGLKELEVAADDEAIKALSIRYLGRKGKVTQFLRSIANLPPVDRPEAGRKANEVKRFLSDTFENALKQRASASLETAEQIDVSLPGRVLRQGSLHPLTQINQQICDIFTRLGFDIAEGPEIETDYYNFEALNIPIHQFTVVIPT